MSRLRLLVACLLMLVLPAQGFAAATLVFCTGHAPDHAAAAVHAEAAHVQHAGAADELAADAAHHHAGHGQPAADDHHCGTCAACCHGVGIADAWTAPASPRLPASDLAEPLVRITGDPLPLPERPPRA